MRSEAGPVTADRARAQRDGARLGSLSVRILGPIEAWAGPRRLDLGGHRQQALLAALILEANRAVTADVLIDRLWGEAGGGSRKGLQMAIMRLRHALGAGGDAGEVIRTVGGGYLLTLARDRLDAARFEDEVKEGMAALRADDPESAATTLAAALGLWRGQVLAEVAFEDFAQVETRRLNELRLMAVESRIEALISLGHHGDVIGELESLMLEHPTRERLVRLLMVALYRSARQADALEAYQRVRARLAQELGLPPGPELQALHWEILTHSAAAGPAPGAMARGNDSARRGEHRPQRPRPAPPALAPALAGRLQNTFAGRAGELERIRQSLDTAASGPSWIFVRGEAGIGKTTLLARAGHELIGEGWVLGYGRHDRQSLAPYQPLTEAFRDLLEQGWAPPEDSEADLAALLPGLPGLAGNCPGRLGGPERVDTWVRRRPAELLIGWLASIARQTRVLLVLDDMQRIDRGTLAMLSCLRRRSELTGLLLLASYDDGDLDARDPLVDLTRDIRRHDGGTEIALDGLDPGACAELANAVSPAAHSARSAHSAQAVAELWSQTRGNPLFITELLGDLRERGVDLEDALPLDGTFAERAPAGVGDVVGQRLAGLSDRTIRLLELASVAAPEIELELLVAVGQDRLDDVEEVLGIAMRARLLEELEGAPGRFAFTHPLIQAALLGRLSRIRRCRLHARLAMAVQARGDRLGWPPGARARLARHLLAAGALADVERVAEAAVGAAPDAPAALPTPYAVR